MCELGVIGMGQGGKQQYWAPYGTWKEKSENLTVSKELKALRKEVEVRNRNESQYITITLAKAQQAILGQCKNQICRGKCGCRRNNRFCTSSCHCAGNCTNTTDFFKPAE